MRFCKKIYEQMVVLIQSTSWELNLKQTLNTQRKHTFYLPAELNYLNLIIEEKSARKMHVL